MLQVRGIRAELTIREGVGGGKKTRKCTAGQRSLQERISTKKEKMQPIQNNGIPTQRVRKGVDGCFSPLLSRIPQESLGHASCGFQLHRHKQPPTCKMVYCASAEKISPHQSCPASAGSVSEGSSLSAFRKPNTGSHVTLQREEKNPHVCICWQIWTPTPV